MLGALAAEVVRLVEDMAEDMAEVITNLDIERVEWSVCDGRLSAMNEHKKRYNRGVGCAGRGLNERGQWQSFAWCVP